ncbi:MAG TPA: AzlD domain-containing protein [Thermomicrobiales bacterium]|nr:AzlD domain-containing protein [Thermomicrobiales bacterium]
MERIALILAVAVASYATRIAGFTLDRQAIPRRLDRALTYVPIAAFTALIVPGLRAGDGGALDPIRIAAAILAAAVVLLTRQLWAALLAGMTVFWLL